MLRIACPHCGVRDEVEFRYRGDASVRRPGEDAGVEAYYDYVYERDNPAGWHLEWWQHVHGCRQVLKVLRDTVSHEIQAVVAGHGFPAGATDGSRRETVQMLEISQVPLDHAHGTIERDLPGHDEIALPEHSA
ncbi:sarcosine oxidase subunit delta [Labrys neptuniae]|uniref:sarcosine oxidase subunit delta n=1 Tax=Labrys neptuniae TaxID=376174 RepID=UPI0035E1E38E